MYKSIAMRITVSVVPAILITTLLFAMLSYYISNERINETINEKMYESLYAADLQIQAELSKNAAIAMHFAGYATMMKWHQFDWREHERFLTDSILSNTNTFGGGIWFEPYAFDEDSYYFGPFLYSENEETVVFVPEYGSQVDYFSEDWYVKGKASDHKLIWSVVYTDPVSTIKMITATMPFYDKKDNFIGVGTADMNMHNIQDIVSGISIGQTGRAFILGASGEYISFFDEQKNNFELMQNDMDLSLAELGTIIMENESGLAALNRNGEKLRVFYRTMEGINWKLAIVMSEKEISASTLNSFAIMIIIPCIGLLLVLIGIFSVIAYLRRIVGKVNNFADKAAYGNFSEMIDVTETDEFGFMEQRLNTMIVNMNEMSKHSAELLKIAENASVSKSEFLSRMSHEIRTPMNAIIGMTQIARSSNDSTKIKDCLVKIDNASKHLLALINDILDMSKIEANKLELNEEEFDLRQTLTNVCNMISVKAEEKKQKLSLQMTEELPHYIIADELRLSQVMANLLGNAIKFTPENGWISIYADEEQQEDDYSIIQFGVEDSGIGLSDEARAKLFRSFEQGDGSISRKFGGTGLGLAISKRIVEMMGGSIWVQSEVGIGSIFAFTIKVRRGQGEFEKANAQSESGIAKPNEIRALIADDSFEANEYLAHILESFSLDFDRAYNGQEALELVEKAVLENRPYNLIFMDYLMPKLNGIAAAKKIKEISSDSMAIIMVSIYDWADIEKEAAEVGIIRHLPKPFSPSNVYNLINDLVQGKISSKPLLIKKATYTFENNTILLAEDIDINREIVEALLEDTKIKIDFAENGIEAVERFKSNPDKYDLILMDIQMPMMDGFEATKQIRQLEQAKAKIIPIIAMTANALDEDIERCLQAGMNDHVAKPIEPEILLNKLNNYIY